MIPALILAACAPAAPTNDPVSVGNPRQASATPVESSAATQSTEPEAQIVSAQPAFEARLTAVRSGAKVIRSGGIELELAQDEMENIQVDDGIKVVTPESQAEQGYSILDFGDYLEVELFSNTSVFLADLKQGAGDAKHVTLHLDGGHIFLHPNDQSSTRVTVQTPYTTIKTLMGGTQFDVCYTEELTCVLVTKGIVEVTGRNRKQIVKAGEAGVVLEDQHPSSPICAPASTFTEWEDSYRQSADTPALELELSELPQEPCALTAAGLPADARILYQDNFINPFSGWARGKVDNFIVRYAGLNYYRVEAQDSENQFITSIPNEPEYGDVNVDVRAIAEAASGGDFRYGPVLRRSGDQYYAFIVSPSTKKWYFLKSSADGLETLREGTDERMRGLEGKDALRVEAYGSLFIFYVNGRFIDWISDPDYASGEVGLFVETMDNPDAIIRFDTIILWDVPDEPVIPDTGGGREYCFNASDDDGDNLIDRADPDCQRKDATSTPLPTNTSRPANTSTPRPTSTPQPTDTRPPTVTRTPRPPNTPTNTEPPPPTNTDPPPPTNTDPPPPTNTDPPPPTNTDPPPPTATDPPAITEPPVEPTASGLPITLLQTGFIGVRENPESAVQKTRSYVSNQLITLFDGTQFPNSS